jgi:hypothetical protein
LSSYIGYKPPFTGDFPLPAMFDYHEANAVPIPIASKTLSPQDFLGDFVKGLGDLPRKK